MNEWGFASEVSKWWEGQFRLNPSWKLVGARVEEVVPGSKDRSDLFVFGNGPVLCGELRLPDHVQPSPWHPDNLLDAINKATIHGCRWAFTSDTKTFVLIDTHLSGPPLSRIVHQIELGISGTRKELDSPAFLSRVEAAWIDLIRVVAPIITGATAPPGMPPDELFINALRALLSASVAAIREELHHRRADAKFEQRLVEWMVDDQGWTHSPAHWDSEIFKAAQLTAYVFATRLVFYDALRRSQSTLTPLGIPVGASARVAQATIGALFDEARDLSKDYQTLFGWDAVSEFALSSDAGVDAWRRVIEHISHFDVSAIRYDILGKLFERLIDPYERYRWGQHYTSPDVVDLMLSMAIPDGEGTILDPATGGGTFLVRAYSRKQVLLGADHQTLLSELYGLDTSGFAATLATVNLAVRQLEFADNYPRVATRSFFQVEPGAEFMSIPMLDAKGEKEPRAITVPAVRAVVGNPPYIRVHELGEERKREAARVLGRVTGKGPTPSTLKGAANYHLYFWLHGAQFLEDGGRLVFITSGEWLDSDYGAELKLWLLNHFKIEAMIESLAEPWFSEARVGTVVVSARLEPSGDARDANEVRFVLLRKTLRELYGTATDEAHHWQCVDVLRDRLLSLQSPEGESNDMDWSVVRQAELRTLR